jgi:hypothetical protein
MTRQDRQSQTTPPKPLPLTRFTQNSKRKKESWGRAVFAIQEAVTQKHKKDTEFKVAADKGH